MTFQIYLHQPRSATLSYDVSKAAHANVLQRAVANYAEE
jgi:hypothetical protein